VAAAPAGRSKAETPEAQGFGITLLPRDMPSVRYSFRGPTPISIKIVVGLALLNFFLGSALEWLSSKPETYAWTSGSIVAAYRNLWFPAHFVFMAAGFVLLWLHRGELVAERPHEIGESASGGPSPMRLAVFVIVGLLGLFSFAHFYLIDGVSGLLLGAFFREDTVYARGYSDSGFRRVRIGMTDHQVETLIGPPLTAWPIPNSPSGADTGERWSFSPGDTHFRCRVLLFRNHRVVVKHAEFYVD
jgi:hypothetical protein